MKHVSFLTRTTKEGWQPFLAWNPVAIFKGQNIKECITFIKKETQKGRTVVGYISFDTGYKLLNIKQTAKDLLKLPEMYFLSYTDNKIQEVKKIFTNKISLKKELNLNLLISKEKYLTAFKKIKEYIADGHVYQINLTHQLKGHTDLSARELFVKIMKNNEAGNLAYIEGDSFEVLSASPEHFVKTHDGIIESWPVKGTRPRGKTKKEDEQLRQDLLHSGKEKAELDMITDLLRNDIGKVSEYATVKVKNRRIITKYPTLFHARSHIQGILKKSMSPVEALFSMVPGGSVTGVPKKRALEIIDELEPIKRSVYCGAIGIIDRQGEIDFNIAIRTLIKKGNQVYLSVGGGIVYDSDADREYQETLDKAKTFIF